MGSSYWMPLANSATPIKAFFSAILSRIFSSSLSCFSMALSFFAKKNKQINTFTFNQPKTQNT